MTAKNKAQNQEQPPTDTAEKRKTCFIIMPIADHPDYETGHFSRVYEHLIKPACIKAGFIPIRADDSKASHMIMFDILKKITECDMAICDLSSKNANVFYELGLRQAFNKKTILITDGRDKAPFDISGFRYVTYSPSLRVDTVRMEIDDIHNMLIETESAPEDDVNSIVKLLKINPAQIDPLQLNQNESVIFNMFSKLQDKIDNISDSYASSNIRFNRNSSGRNLHTTTYYTAGKNKIINPDISISLTFADVLINSPEMLYSYEYIFDGVHLGKLVSMDEDFLKFSEDELIRRIPNHPEMQVKIFAIP